MTAARGRLARREVRRVAREVRAKGDRRARQVALLELQPLDRVRGVVVDDPLQRVHAPAGPRGRRPGRA